MFDAAFIPANLCQHGIDATRRCSICVADVEAERLSDEKRDQQLAEDPGVDTRPFRPGDEVYKGSEFFVVEQSVDGVCILIRPHTGRQAVGFWPDLRHVTENDRHRAAAYAGI